MIKDIDYYMTLNYIIELVKIPDDEGGGWEAGIPLLGRYWCCADGSTVEEAVRNLEKIKYDVIKEMLRRGIPIPEPLT